jgi:hypothetical protein
MISFLTALKFAFRTFFAILLHHRIPGDVLSALAASAVAPPPGTVEFHVPATAPPLVPPPSPAEGNARAAQMLALLQRDGRLIDFLMEDVTSYNDAQVGAAVRSVHAGCRQTLQQYVTLTPAVDAAEGASISVAAGTDAATVKVMGNVAGQPPFTGIVRHRGWIASHLELPPIPASARLVVAPAEVEVP